MGSKALTLSVVMLLLASTFLAACGNRESESEPTRHTTKDTTKTEQYTTTEQATGMAEEEKWALGKTEEEKMACIRDFPSVSDECYQWSFTEEADEMKSACIRGYPYVNDACRQWLKNEEEVQAWLRGQANESWEEFEKEKAN
jgi:hypothetical protein